MLARLVKLFPQKLHLCCLSGWCLERPWYLFLSCSDCVSPALLSFIFLISLVDDCWKEPSISCNAGMAFSEHFNASSLSGASWTCSSRSCSLLNAFRHPEAMSLRSQLIFWVSRWKFSLPRGWTGVLSLLESSSREWHENGFVKKLSNFKGLPDHGRIIVSNQILIIIKISFRLKFVQAHRCCLLH